MSDTPNRSIGGLAPRSGTPAQPDLSRLQRRNRTNPPTPLSRPEPATISVLPQIPQQIESKAAPTSMEVQAPGQSSDLLHAAQQDRITVYLDHALRARARTAYRATAHLEGDRTWSDFIEKAIRAEVERREGAHNGAQAYSGTTEQLAPGRPVS